MESSQLRRISIIGLSILCLSPIEFFSNKLFESNNESTVILAVNDIKYRENYLSNNYEIFNPNIKTTSENLKTTVVENKKNESSDKRENKEESENNSENNKEDDLVTEETVVEVVESVSTEEITTEVISEPVTEVWSAPIVWAEPTDTDLASSLVNYALQFVGKPYRYGGADLYSGVDCSGFTMKIYENFGYSLPHTASSQSGYGNYVSIDALQPGDLVFYGYNGVICHVAIYIGNGQIVHAATSDTGITVANLYIMPIITAKRIINN